MECSSEGIASIILAALLLFSESLPYLSKLFGKDIEKYNGVLQTVTELIKEKCIDEVQVTPNPVNIEEIRVKNTMQEASRAKSSVTENINETTVRAKNIITQTINETKSLTNNVVETIAEVKDDASEVLEDVESKVVEVVVADEKSSKAEVADEKSSKEKVADEKSSKEEVVDESKS
tara:strand:- start:907 stop:1437 length:531 start_codon:yes stop_codon:yes gene_type:complete